MPRRPGPLRSATTRLGAAMVAVMVVAGCSETPYDEFTAEAGVTTTTAAAPSTTAPTTVAGNEPFTDPEGRYTIEIDPAWLRDDSAVIDGVENWFIGPPEGPFTPNLNISSQEAPGIGSDPDAPTEILDGTIDGLGVLDGFSLRGQDVIQGSAGQTLAVLEYGATILDQSLAFVQVFAIGSDHVALATLTVPLASLDTHKTTMTPYLTTLQAS